MVELALGAGIMFLGALVQGTTGFGIALVAAPGLLLILPHTQVPVIVILLALFNNAIVLWDLRREASFRRVLPLIIGGVLGLPGGALILRYADPLYFKLGVALLVLSAAAVLISGIRVKLSNERLAMLPVGVVSGILKTSTSISGPPIALFLANQGADKARFRSSLVVYFIVVDTLAVVVWALFGMVTAPILATTAAYILPVLAGSWCGVLISRRLGERAFRLIVLVLVVTLGLVLLTRSVAELLKGT